MFLTYAFRGVRANAYALHILIIRMLNFYKSGLFTGIAGARSCCLSGAVGGQSVACYVELAQHGETHTYFILACGKSRAIDSTSFLLLCKQQRP